MIEVITRDFEAVDLYHAEIKGYTLHKEQRVLQVNFCKGVNCEKFDLESNILLEKSQCTGNFIGVTHLKLEIYEYADQIRGIDFKDKTETIIDFKEYVIGADNDELHPFTAILVQPFRAYTSWEIKAESFFLEWDNGSGSSLG
jgi:hypothetical protein